MSLKVVNGPTIPAGQSMSDGMDCTGSTRIVRLMVPETWTSAPLTFCLSPDNVGKYHDLYNVVPPSFDNFEVTVRNVVAGSALTVPEGLAANILWFKVRAGVHAAPVKQTVDQVFQVILEMPDDASGGGGTGTQGPAGPTGPAGAPGTAGATGPAGVPGTAGGPGPAGPTGSAGAAGATGPTGTFNLKGTVAGDDAAAGNVGEFQAANNNTGVQLTTLVTANVTTLPLPAGDWSVTGVVIFTPAGTGPNSVIAAVSQVSATLPTDNQVLAGGTSMFQAWSSAMPSGKTQTVPVGVCRINVSASTNVYLVAQSSFGGGSVTVTGRITARRAR